MSMTAELAHLAEAAASRLYRVAFAARDLLAPARASTAAQSSAAQSSPAQSSTAQSSTAPASTAQSSSRGASLRRIAPLTAVVVVSGCQRDVLVLDERWAPLVEVVERPNLVLGDEASSTLGDRLYVADLADWERRYPEDTPERDALLLHEREHARRQAELGLGRWLGRYLEDRDFMWQEERRGWALELTHLIEHDVDIHPDVVAIALHEYRNLSGRMCSLPQAVEFVDAVLAGRWR